MHIIIGLLIVAGSFLLAMQYFSADFDGFWNLYSDHPPGRCPYRADPLLVSIQRDRLGAQRGVACIA